MAVQDALDVFIKHRLHMAAQQPGQPAVQNPRNNFPPELMRRFEVYFRPASGEKHVDIRNVKAEHIGKLVSVRGIVTRATEVKPMMQVIQSRQISKARTVGRTLLVIMC